MQEYGTLIRIDEAMSLLAEYKDDLVMSQLLNYANYVVIGRFQSDTPEELPVADFDLFFYLKTVEHFCREQEFLEAVLAKQHPPQFEDKLNQIKQTHYLVKRRVKFYMEDAQFHAALAHFLGDPGKPSLGKEWDSRVDGSHIGFVRWREALRLLRSVEERTTKWLMLYVTYIALQHWGSSREPLVAPFDFYFFMRAMQSFCGDHLFLTKVLNGEDLRWFSVA